MFNVLNEIQNKLNYDDAKFINEFSVINISNRYLYIEGHKGVVLISNEQLKIKLKKTSLVVCGENFVLKELTENTAFLSGKISKMEFLDEI